MLPFQIAVSNSLSSQRTEEFSHAEFNDQKLVYHLLRYRAVNLRRWIGVWARRTRQYQRNCNRPDRGGYLRSSNIGQEHRNRPGYQCEYRLGGHLFTAVPGDWPLRDN